MADYHKQDNLPELRTLTKLSLSNKIQVEQAKMLMPRICQEYWICYLFVHVAMHELSCLIWRVQKSMPLNAACQKAQAHTSRHYELYISVHCVINKFDSAPGSSLELIKKISLHSLPITYSCMLNMLHISSYHKKGIDKHKEEFQDLKFVVCFHLAFTYKNLKTKKEEIWRNIHFFTYKKEIKTKWRLTHQIQPVCCLNATLWKVKVWITWAARPVSPVMYPNIVW